MASAGTFRPDLDQPCDTFFLPNKGGERTSQSPCVILAARLGEVPPRCQIDSYDTLVLPESLSGLGFQGNPNPHVSFPSEAEKPPIP